jgi:plastocyanin
MALLVCAMTVHSVVPAIAQGPAPSRIASPVPPPTPTPPPPGAITLEVVLMGGKIPLPGDDSVAWMPTLKSTGADSDRVKIAQNKKQFEPRIAVVSTGSTVDFPNFDRVFHNVFSLSKPQPFDLGLYRKGKSESVRFEQPGLIQIYCNIHPHMVAYLMVVDSRRHGVADAGGRITLRDIPPGPTVVEGWNVRAGMWSREVSIRPGRTTPLTVELDVSGWREASHLNKYGKEYPPPDDDDFRY